MAPLPRPSIVGKEESSGGVQSGPPDGVKPAVGLSRARADYTLPASSVGRATGHYGAACPPEKHGTRGDLWGGYNLAPLAEEIPAVGLTRARADYTPPAQLGGRGLRAVMAPLPPPANKGTKGGLWGGTIRSPSCSGLHAASTAQWAWPPAVMVNKRLRVTEICKKTRRGRITSIAIGLLILSKKKKQRRRSPVGIPRPPGALCLGG